MLYRMPILIHRRDYISSKDTSGLLAAWSIFSLYEKDVKIYPLEWFFRDKFMESTWTLLHHRWFFETAKGKQLYTAMKKDWHGEYFGKTLICHQSYISIR